MSISRTTFVAVFLMLAFAFQFISNSLAVSEARLFPGHGESFLGESSPIAWKSAVSAILWPVKAILVGPLLPYIAFLRQDPDTPPPFFFIGFAIYWTILALMLHYLLGKAMRTQKA